MIVLATPACPWCGSQPSSALAPASLHLSPTSLRASLAILPASFAGHASNYSQCFTSYFSLAEGWYIVAQLLDSFFRFLCLVSPLSLLFAIVFFTRRAWYRLLLNLSSDESKFVLAYGLVSDSKLIFFHPWTHHRRGALPLPMKANDGLRIYIGPLSLKVGEYKEKKSAAFLLVHFKMIT